MGPGSTGTALVHLRSFNLSNLIEGPELGHGPCGTWEPLHICLAIGGASAAGWDPSASLQSTAVHCRA